MAREDLEKVTLRLTRGAKEKINGFFPTVGYNIVIRKITDNFIKKIEERASQNLEPVDITVDLTVEDLADD